MTWNKKTVDDHISNGVEENIHLDYKGSGSLGKNDSKKKEISKDVSAFANSDGGIIIYGILEYNEKDKSHLPEKIDGIDRVAYPKEWLEQVINSNISPKVSGIRITPIEIDATNNKVVYVVEIPKSNTAHQAKDKRYYKRYNFESVAMEDWEVKDIINRQQTTDAKLFFESNMPKIYIEKYLEKGSKQSILLDLWINNRGNKVINMVECFILVNEETAKKIISPKIDHDISDHLFDNTKERTIEVDGTKSVISTERVAIMPKTSRKMITLKVRLDIFHENSEVQFQISTEDRSKKIKIIGKEFLKYIEN